MRARAQEWCGSRPSIRAAAATGMAVPAAVTPSSSTQAAASAAAAAARPRRLLRRRRRLLLELLSRAPRRLARRRRPRRHDRARLRLDVDDPAALFLLDEHAPVLLVRLARLQIAVAAVARQQAQRHRRRAPRVVLGALVPVHAPERAHRRAARREPRDARRALVLAEQLRTRALVRRAQQPEEADEHGAPRVRLQHLVGLASLGEGEGQLRRHQLRLERAVLAQLA